MGNNSTRPVCTFGLAPMTIAQIQAEKNWMRNVHRSIGGYVRPSTYYAVELFYREHPGISATADLYPYCADLTNGDKDDDDFQKDCRFAQQELQKDNVITNVAYGYWVC